MADDGPVSPQFPVSSSPSNDTRNDPTLNSTTGDTDPANNENSQQQKLVLWQGIALLTADCMGVGILGLPNDMKLLGWAVGISFLVINCPINYYAGNLLSILATDIETKADNLSSIETNDNATEIELATTNHTSNTHHSRQYRY